MPSFSHLLTCAAMHWYSIKAETDTHVLDTAVKAYSPEHARWIFGSERPFWKIVSLQRSFTTPLWFWE